ncbi:MAG: dihydrofolate reductase family protein [Mojavia pulchra JT2-VF2]|uniref:Dihydrofolate reductase family protein n=1 Tax=Mojavia pulchra JT2-VF2 TaxID=287848 RepID=A0A951UGX0_9NOST|nr:dihydrofolate reductase family protein [Mojavia pulchra JT2-VF2]
MTQIIYQVAVSIDGYIAAADGSVDWLSAFQIEDNDYGYAQFYASIDALLMGSRTYEQVIGFGEWAYPGKPCWVVSRRSLKVEQPEVRLTSNSPGEIIAELQAQKLNRVWLVGGGQLAASFRAQGLISEYMIAVIPMILGAGIPLFGSPGLQEHLNLVECKPFPQGVVLLRYLR